MNTTLGKDEAIIKEITFSPNLVLFWIKAHYVLTNKRLTGKHPNTLFGIIPLGKVNISQPLKTIASVACVSKFWFKRLLFGLIFLVLGLIMITASDVPFLVGLFVALIGLGNLLTCYTAYFDVTNNAGQKLGCEVIITAQAEVEAYANQMNMVISDL
ncbi:hypothetical protein [Wenzhouxiangella sp. XN24]|uniref:hypothetical protein n=1 Tax=Wenzhouxiangella sp. XN24 TaxID=2713569 RepID=UPI0013ECEA45|nr:hypothetical protein [Wenzhouxiangella sp. XN24]NGX14796.1 hypothetical protein [Wenzhouxiangella sp. XN24]